MEFYKRENNNFNLVRMIAAYAVIYAHSYAIQPNGRGDIITQLSKVTHAGQLAVFIFVFLTGIYLFDSLKNTKNIAIFFVKKFMRIYPMLILTLVLTIFIGAAFTTLSLKEYFSDPLVYKYFIDNILNIFNAYELPGVFKNHNNPGLNGVLWYVTFIVRIYFVGGIFSWIGLFDTKERMNQVLLILLICVSVAPNAIPLLGGNILLYGNIDFPQYTITVIIAGLVYNNFPTLRVKWQVLILLFIFCMLQKDFTYDNMIGLWAILAIASAVWIGCLPMTKKIKVTDISFEIFLFGWPTSQIVCELCPSLSPIGNTVITILVTTVIGIGLKYTIGKLLNKATKNILMKIEKYGVKNI